MHQTKKHLRARAVHVMGMTSAWAVDTLRRLSAELSSYQDGRRITSDVLDSFSLTLELVYRDLLIQQTLDGLNHSCEQACELVRQALLSIQEMQDSQWMVSVRHTPSVHRMGAVGRPRFDIPREQLSLLIESQFTVPQIADMIGVSERTIHRRMSEYGLSIQSTYSEMTNLELDSVIADIHREFPMCGNKQMGGHLLSRGIRVQQHRIRESMRRIDPEGTLARRLNVIHRRCYSVPSPRSLYHIDGNHKLIR